MLLRPPTDFRPPGAILLRPPVLFGISLCRREGPIDARLELAGIPASVVRRMATKTTIQKYLVRLVLALEA